MATIDNNIYKYTLGEKIFGSIGKRIVYPVNIYYEEVDKEWSNFQINMCGRKETFWVYNNSLRKEEIESIVSESIVSSKINGHSYIRNDSKVCEGDIVIDAGGCEGIFTRYALLCGAKKVYVFEPYEEFAIALQRTFRKEIDEKRVEIVRKALSDKKKTVCFQVDESMKCANRIEEENTTIHSEVECISLDEFVDSHKLSQVNYVKMDIEGEEINAVYGCKRTIQRFNPKFMIAIYHAYENGFLLQRNLLSVSDKYEVSFSGCYKFEEPYRPYMLIAHTKE